jgi:hypothetical protein
MSSFIITEGASVFNEYYLRKIRLHLGNNRIWYFPKTQTSLAYDWLLKPPNVGEYPPEIHFASPWFGKPLRPTLSHNVYEMRDPADRAIVERVRLGIFATAWESGIRLHLKGGVNGNPATVSALPSPVLNVFSASQDSVDPGLLNR